MAQKRKSTWFSSRVHEVLIAQIDGGWNEQNEQQRFNFNFIFTSTHRIG